MKYLLLVCSSLMLFVSCSKDIESTVPNVPVNIRLNLDNPAYIQLNSIGGSMSIEGGNRGIIVYHRGFEDYVALERTCSYSSTDTCA